MTVRSLLGLALLNVFLFAIGAGLFWGLRGWRSWVELARLSGVAYMLGAAGLGVGLSFELVVGIPFSLRTVVLTGLALGGGGVAAGALLRRPLPTWREGSARAVAPVVAVYGVLVVVYLEALFRAGRLASLSAWDAWAFWVPKAKAIYFFEGLDEQFFRELPNPTYPPLLPALEASTFLFMGSADVVTLHLQFWFFLCGFAAALVGLLAPRVSPLVLWPTLLLVLVAPRVVGRSLEPQADFFLDYLFALAALLVALWLVERQTWQLASAALLLGAAMLTKREGLLLAACVLVAALAASWRTKRYAWPRLALVGVVALLLAVPWRLWFSTRDLTGELPEAGALALFENLDRAWPAVESVLTTLVDYDLWLATLPLAAAAVVLAFLGGARVLPVYASLVYGLAAAGFTWVLWSFTELELPIEQDEAVNPIVRLVGSLVLLSAALVPLLLEAAWRGRGEAIEGRAE
ncbi:MAG: hypothetical protein ACRDPZ_10070 [Gaiellaceae bacterium]